MASSPVTPLNKALISSFVTALEIALQTFAEHHPDDHKVQDFCNALSAALASGASTLASL